DIPAQARELYRRNAIRTIPDVGYTPALLEPPRYPTTKQPLDMSHCILRSVSPVHIKYLRNMGVGASMSVSLLPSGGLWGLIAGHNAKPRAVLYEAQEACRHVGEILAQYIRAREESLEHRLASDLSAVRDRVMRQLFAAEDPSALMRTLGPDLQAVVPSNGSAIVRNGTVMLAGSCPTEAQVRDLSAWFELRTADTEFFATDRLADEYPPARAFTAEASGLLAVRLPGNDVVILMWFRAEQVQEIYWAGNPHESLQVSNGLGTLNPRKSFATWVEAVRGRSRPWDAVEIESAKMFSPRIAFVLQQKRVRELNALLTSANEQLAALALQDGLTGIANRRAFDERLRAEWTRASRSKKPVALLVLDVDFFKNYNDHYGHTLGDTCLKQIAQVLSQSRRAADLAARIGGEEFSLILPDTSIDSAKLVADNVRARIEALQLPHAKSASGVVTVSVGIAAGTADKFGSATALMDAADKALYKAKTSGRNRSVAA
ncbi:MAG: diguanylate cyclase, partial [Deltaproteobacteria bacterium]